MFGRAISASVGHFNLPFEFSSDDLFQVAMPMKPAKPITLTRNSIHAGKKFSNIIFPSLSNYWDRRKARLECVSYLVSG